MNRDELEAGLVRRMVALSLRERSIAVERGRIYSAARSAGLDYDAMRALVELRRPLIKGLNPQRVLDVALHEENVDEVEAEHLARSMRSTEERPTIDPYQQLPEGPSTVPAAGDFYVGPDDGEAL